MAMVSEKLVVLANKTNKLTQYNVNTMKRLSSSPYYELCDNVILEETKESLTNMTKLFAGFF